MAWIVLVSYFSFYKQRIISQSFEFLILDYYVKNVVDI